MMCVYLSQPLLLMFCYNMGSVSTHNNFCSATCFSSLLCSCHSEILHITVGEAEDATVLLRFYACVSIAGGYPTHASWLFCFVSEQPALIKIDDALLFSD